MLYRNEQYQEELWRISFDLLQDWMSPEIWSKYSPSTKATTKQESGNNDGVDDQPLTTTDKEDKPPLADEKSPEVEHER